MKIRYFTLLLLCLNPLKGFAQSTLFDFFDQQNINSTDQLRISQWLMQQYPNANLTELKCNFNIEKIAKNPPLDITEEQFQKDLETNEETYFFFQTIKLTPPSAQRAPLNELGKKRSDLFNFVIKSINENRLYGKKLKSLSYDLQLLQNYSVGSREFKDFVRNYAVSNQKIDFKQNSKYLISFDYTEATSDPTRSFTYFTLRATCEIQKKIILREEKPPETPVLIPLPLIPHPSLTSKKEENESLTRVNPFRSWLKQYHERQAERRFQRKIRREQKHPYRCPHFANCPHSRLIIGNI